MLDGQIEDCYLEVMINVSLWDADFIPFYVCHVKKNEPEKSLDDCKALVDDIIVNINNATMADEYQLYVTVGKCFRYNVYPEYKANRKYTTVVKHIFETKQYLIDQYKAFIHIGLEADDLVCINKQRLTEKGYKCTIISPDKDILNLEGRHYNPRGNNWVNTTKQDAELYFWKSMITGDTVDNLPGIKGIGEVGACKLLDNKQIDIFKSYRSAVFDKYCEVYGEEYGIAMFYKMYNCLKMVHTFEVEIPELIKLKTEISEEEKLFG